MSKAKRIRKQIKSKIEVIKKINEDPKKTADDLFDLYLDDLPSSQDFLGKKLDNFKEKRSKKKDNNESIFDGILDIANSFLSDKESKVKVKEGKPKHINEGSAKLKKMGLQAAKKTVPQIKKITLDSIKQTLFVLPSSLHPNFHNQHLIFSCLLHPSFYTIHCKWRLMPPSYQILA